MFVQLDFIFTKYCFFKIKCQFFRNVAKSLCLKTTIFTIVYHQFVIYSNNLILKVPKESQLQT